MARDYGRISTGFWNHPKIRSCGDQAKLLANYLMTGPHSNSIGAYLLPDAYVADDLGWTAQTVSKAFAELFGIGFAQRFADGRHVVVCDILEWNPIENPNVAVAAKKQLDLLPDDPALMHVFNGLKPYARHFRDGFETVAERFRNIEPNRTEPEPEPEPSSLSAVADEIPAALQAYNAVAEEIGWPQAQAITSKRKSALKARLADDGGIEGWRAAMARERASPFLRGESGRDRAHEKWTPDLDFFLQQSSFVKLMEGKYDDRAAAANDRNSDVLRGISRAVAGYTAASG
jgi:hypothetical protein